MIFARYFFPENTLGQTPEFRNFFPDLPIGVKPDFLKTNTYLNTGLEKFYSALICLQISTITRESIVIFGVPVRCKIIRTAELFHILEFS